MTELRDAPEAIRTRRDGAVTVITLSRPQARNAVDGPTALALRLLGGDLGGGYFTTESPPLQWHWGAAVLYGVLGVLAVAVAADQRDQRLRTVLEQWHQKQPAVPDGEDTGPFDRHGGSVKPARHPH